MRKKISKFIKYLNITNGDCSLVRFKKHVFTILICPLLLIGYIMGYRICKICNIIITPKQKRYKIYTNGISNDNYCELCMRNEKRKSRI